MTTLADLVTVSRTGNTIHLWLATEVPPHVNMTQAGKWVEERAIAYNEFHKTWKERIRMAMAVNKVEPLPGKVPLFVSLVFQYECPFHSFDVENLEKSAIDLCQRIVFLGVDSWIDRKVTDRIWAPTGVSITFGRL